MESVDGAAVDQWLACKKKDRVMNSKDTLTVSLIGTSWVLIGLGYQALVIQYIPEGASLVVEGLGLFLAGVVTAALFLRSLEALDNSLSRILITIGYLLFSPLGMMVGLIVSGSMEPMAGGSSLPFVFGAPLLMMLTATLAVVVGLGFTGGLAVAARRVNASPETGG